MADILVVEDDRDLNAAINLERLAKNNTESSSWSYALGQDGSVAILWVTATSLEEKGRQRQCYRG